MNPKFRALTCVALAAGIAMGAPPRAVPPLTLGENYRFGLTAKISGAEFPCSLDSGGGDRVYLDKAMALAAGIQPTGEGRSAGPQASSMQTDLRAKISLELGGLKLEEQTALLQNRPYAGYECVIGMTVLKRYAVELDYRRSELRIHEASGYRPPPAGKAIPISFEQGNPFVTATLSFLKGEPVTARLAVDTGGGRPAGFLTKSFVDKHGLMARVGTTAPDFMFGMGGGQPKVLAARFERIEIGALILPRLIFYLWQVRGFGGGVEPDGLLCQNFLRRLTVISDYPRSQLILVTGPDFAQESPFDASGAFIYRQGDKPHTVYSVIAGPPAAEAGVKEGDLVISLDGRAAAGMSNAEIAKALQADGREVALQVKRGEETLRLKLKLRRLV